MMAQNTPPDSDGIKKQTHPWIELIILAFIVVVVGFCIYPRPKTVSEKPSIPGAVQVAVDAAKLKLGTGLLRPDTWLEVKVIVPEGRSVTQNVYF